MDRVNDAAARRHFSRHTIDCYSRWVRQFLIFCRDGQRWRTPAELGGADVSRFLTHLAAERRSARSTQTQALKAIVFLYRDVLGDELGADHLGPIDGLRVDRRARVPTVLSTDEVRQVIGAMAEGSTFRLMAETLYGTGLRVAECCTLRVRDVDFDRGQILVRGGKGDRDRVVMLPKVLAGRLGEQVRWVRGRHARDVAQGGGEVPLPDVLVNKVPYAEPGLAVAVRVPEQGGPAGRGGGAGAAVARASRPGGPGGPDGGGGGGGRQAGVAAHVPPQLRDAPAGGGVRRAAGAAPAGARGSWRRRCCTRTS